MFHKCEAMQSKPKKKVGERKDMKMKAEKEK